MYVYVHVYVYVYVYVYVSCLPLGGNGADAYYVHVHASVYVNLHVYAYAPFRDELFFFGRYLDVSSPVLLLEDAAQMHELFSQCLVGARENAICMLAGV